MLGKNFKQCGVGRECKTNETRAQALERVSRSLCVRDEWCEEGERPFDFPDVPVLLKSCTKRHLTNLPGVSSFLRHPLPDMQFDT